MANSFQREKAKIKVCYRHFLDAGGKDRYVKCQFNLIEYDDNSGTYIVPVNYSTGESTWQEANPDATQGDLYIFDTVPYTGVTQFD